MEQEDQDKMYERRNPRILSGLFLLIIGGALLVYKMGAPVPGWLFTWPVLLMVIGFFIGVRSRFYNPASFILLLVGAIFFIDAQLPGMQVHNYIFPIILISLGILFLFRPRHSCGGAQRHAMRMQRRMQRMDMRFNQPSNNFGPAPRPASNTADDNSEYIDINAVFGGVKKNIQSKNFKGGEIVAFMGGCELNFMHADIQEPVHLEINNVFGGTKLIIPGDWHLKNRISAVFGGVEDKRSLRENTESAKTLILTGSCVFGGIEVTNY